MEPKSKCLQMREGLQMLKRIAVIAAAVVVVFAIAGCSSGAASSAASSGSEGSSTVSASASGDASSAAASLFSDLAWPENHVTEGVPVPSFSVAPSSVNESDNVAGAVWEGVTDQEALDYVEQVKGAGFTYDARETKTATTYSYDARDNEDILDCTIVRINYSAKTDSADSSFRISVERINA